MPRTRTYRLLTLLCFLVLAANTWLAARSLHLLFQAEHLLNHTLDVLSETQRANNELFSAYNDSRAFWLSGDEGFRQRFFRREAALRRDIDQIQRLTQDNASQQERIRVLRQRMVVRFSAIDTIIAIDPYHTHRPVDPHLVQVALSDTPDGGLSPTYVVAQIEGEARRILAERRDTTADARTRVLISFTTAAVLDFVLLLAAFELLSRAQRSRLELARRAGEIIHLNRELTVANATLEESVAARTRELEVSNQELQAFSYSVSHDLRAPLRTIDGFSLALEEDFADLLNDEGRDYIRRVRSGVQRMGTLIDALLQLSRVTRSEVQREAVNLSSLATLVFGELHGTDGRNVKFTADPEVIAEADPRLMRVAFENLLGNALKFTSKTADASIHFGTTSRGSQNVYFIRDNGAGFDMQYVDRLFTAFQRLHGDRDFKGSGIGLATVSRIIRRHSGDIWAEGKIGEGATFYFTLDPSGALAAPGTVADPWSEQDEKGL